MTEPGEAVSGPKTKIGDRIEVDTGAITSGASELLNESPRISVDILRSRDDDFPWPVITIDDFFAEPDEIRSLALSLDYDARRGFYPGLDAKIAVAGWPIAKVIENLAANVLPQLYGIETGKTVSHMSLSTEFTFAQEEPIRGIVPLAERWKRHTGQLRANDVAMFSIYHLPRDFQLMVQMRGITHSRLPHVDRIEHEHLVFSCIVYLNPPEQEHGGTYILRHKPTGLIGFVPQSHTSYDELAQRHGYPSGGMLFDDVTYRSFIVGDNPDQERWEVAKEFPNRFNRFVAFPGNLLHSAAEFPMSVGPLAERRLTANAFVHAPGSTIRRG